MSIRGKQDAAGMKAALQGNTTRQINAKKSRTQKSPALRYWPREADTITFQEGLLNFRATGGGGHMRSAAVQRPNTMIPIGALQQAAEPHVSHAESGVFIKAANPQSGMTKPSAARAFSSESLSGT
jgi:hypothetical protein